MPRKWVSRCTARRRAALSAPTPVRRVLAPWPMHPPISFGDPRAQRAQAFLPVVIGRVGQRVSSPPAKDAVPPAQRGGNGNARICWARHPWHALPRRICAQLRQRGGCPVMTAPRRDGQVCFQGLYELIKIGVVGMTGMTRPGNPGVYGRHTNSASRVAGVPDVRWRMDQSP